MKTYSNDIKKKAVELRKKGLSLLEISQKLHIPKNTIQGWIKSIQLTKFQKLRIKEKIAAGGLKGRKKALEVNKHKLDLWKNDIRDRARQYVRSFSNNAKLGKLICGILYLCEGAKYPATRYLLFGNSDPRMIKLFLKLLRRNFKLDKKKFRCRIMHRWDQDGERLKKFWSKENNVPLAQFYKCYADKRTMGLATKKEDYKGICAIHYFDTNIQFELQSIGEALY